KSSCNPIEHHLPAFGELVIIGLQAAFDPVIHRFLRDPRVCLNEKLPMMATEQPNHDSGQGAPGPTLGLARGERKYAMDAVLDRFDALHEGKPPGPLRISGDGIVGRQSQYMAPLNVESLPYCLRRGLQGANQMPELLALGEGDGQPFGLPFTREYASKRL